MKKRLLSALLALCMALALLPAGLAANSGSAGYSDSGSTAMAKLTKSEIVQLMQTTTLSSPTQIYSTAPDLSAPYSAGSLRQDVLQTGLNRLNALRRIAGLPSVTLDASYTASAQAAALVNAVNNEMSHYPTQPADMGSDLYKQGYNAAGRSNLAYYYGLSPKDGPIAFSVDIWMDDSDFYNIDRLGHRRWLLNPTMGKTGFGAVYSSYGPLHSAGYSFDTSGASVDYDFIAWPASGNFPTVSRVFNYETAWSVTLNPNKYQKPSLSAVTVTLVRQSDGKSWTFDNSVDYYYGMYGKYFNVENSGYGVSNCIIFRPDVTKYEGVYTVTITGLKTKSGAAATLSYQVDFFDPANYTPEPEPETPAITFPDVPEGTYYTDAVAWAVKEGYVQGKPSGLFAPNDTCSEAEILTLLHHAVGYPKYTNEAPFAASLPTYCRDAVNWAYENGLINDSFQYNTPCTRAKTVYFLWMAKGSQSPKGEASFSDVPTGAYYAKAVAWAMEEGIVQGDGSGAFNPNDVFNRAMVATLVYKTLVPEARANANG